MNKFLEIVYKSQAENGFDKGYEENFEPVLEKLHKLLSNSLYDEVEDVLFECAIENGKQHAIKGMELAIGIMDGTYVPKL